MRTRSLGLYHAPEQPSAAIGDQLCLPCLALARHGKHKGGEIPQAIGAIRSTSPLLRTGHTLVRFRAAYCPGWDFGLTGTELFFIIAAIFSFSSSTNPHLLRWSNRIRLATETKRAEQRQSGWQDRKNPWELKG